MSTENCSFTLSSTSTCNDLRFDSVQEPGVLVLKIAGDGLATLNSNTNHSATHCGTAGRFLCLAPVTISVFSFFLSGAWSAGPQNRRLRPRDSKLEYEPLGHPLRLPSLRRAGADGRGAGAAIRWELRRLEIRHLELRSDPLRPPCLATPLREPTKTRLSPPEKKQRRSCFNRTH